MEKHKKINFVFFGTPEFAINTLDELEKHGISPSLVVTAPDRPAGRGMKMASSPVFMWAKKRRIPILQPEKLNSEFAHNMENSGKYDVFIVAAYGRIIPKAVLDIPRYGTLNIHPSLLPKFRGASPLQSSILSGDDETGVSIMLMDTELDHGDIIEYHKGVKINGLNSEQLGEKLFNIGGNMLSVVMPKWIAGEINAKSQNHTQATYTKKIRKSDGQINPDDDAEILWRKFRAYHPWPGIFFFTQDGVRVKITDATFKDNIFIIKRVIPERGKEVDYEKFIS